jgi:hypothetical protein
MAAIVGALLALGGGAIAHTARPPPPLVAPPSGIEEIPEDDEPLYHSYVTGISPPVRGLEARILGPQDKLEVRWTGGEPLVIEGAQGEPMIRISRRGIEVNDRSASAHLSAERYGRVPIPGTVAPSARPAWRLIDSPGPISWYEHRAQWMEAERPEVVGDGTRSTTVFHWTVPARLAGRRVAIRGNLDWIADRGAIRDRRSDVSSPLLSAAILVLAMAIGAGIGVAVRDRFAPEP